MMMMIMMMIMMMMIMMMIMMMRMIQHVLAGREALRQVSEGIGRHDRDQIHVRFDEPNRQLVV